ncbi:MAG: site-2 protease family protein [Verrucomicrobiota bacterium]|nr:site-2 protease family protein [Verrucomicrobiota bacterium]
MRFQYMGFPVSVHWWFWLTMFLLGGGIGAQSSADFLIPVLFTLAAFVSIMVHELGHAIAGRKYGAVPSIHLHGFGGATMLPGAYFNRNQSMMVSFAGPLASMGLALAAFILLPLVSSIPLLAVILQIMVFINIFWTILNLLPIQPLDGGQIFRDYMGPSGRETTRWVGVILASLVALWALQSNHVFLCMMMAYMAYMNYNESPGEGGVITR